MYDTVSQNLFEKFCSNYKILCKRIPCKKDSKTADYEIFVNNQKIIVEVKQTELNQRQKAKIIKALKERKYVIYPNENIPTPSGKTVFEPGRQIRKKITDASPQIKAIPGTPYLFSPPLLT